MKKIILFILITLFTTFPAISLELDMSVDEEIKKKYNSNKLNEDVLPSLPKTVTTPSKSASNNTAKNTTVTVPVSTPTYDSNANINVQPVVIKNGVKIPAWTKFQVKSNVKINDWLAKGSSVSFTSTAPVYKKSFTIPSGTVFTGIIEDIHRPQASGNGGLVEIHVTSMRFNGKNITVNGKVTKANGKKIFFNNIKGEHQYISSVGKQVDKGENFYKKSRTTSSKLASNPLGTIISPIPTIVGWVGYALCTAASPVTGLAGKGGDVSIPAGSAFEIKLLDSIYLQ